LTHQKTFTNSACFHAVCSILVTRTITTQRIEKLHLISTPIWKSTKSVFGKN